MPQSRNRKNHGMKRTSLVPAKQRVKPAVIWAALFGVLAFILCYFSISTDAVALVIAVAVGIIGGIAMGKAMEKDV